MSPPQKILAGKYGWGGIILMMCSKLIPDLCRYLMKHFDPTNCELDFGDRGSIPVNAESVAQVLGVPMGNSPVPYHLHANATKYIFEMFGITNGVHPNVTSLEKDLGPEHAADIVYLQKFVMYLVSSVFAPTTSVRVSPRCYPAVANPEAMTSYNWARFIVDIIVQTANAKDTKNWFKACMPYLMVSSS
jgi:hypothetical protein